MPAIEVGRVCYKIRGRDAGQRVVVVGMEKEGYVLIEGVMGKKTRCNILHLMPSPKTVTLGNTYTKKELKEMLAQ